MYIHACPDVYNTIAIRKFGSLSTENFTSAAAIKMKKFCLLRDDLEYTIALWAP